MAYLKTNPRLCDKDCDIENRIELNLIESYFNKIVYTSETTSITSNEKTNILGYCCYCLSNLLFTIVNSKIFQ